MTQANNQPNDYSGQIRYINRRIERLEDTQITPQEFDRAFERVHVDTTQIKDEISEIKNRLDRVENQLQEINRKFDVVMRYVTAQGNPGDS